jgi:Spy/CpxP family protein refolding chaperone
MFAAALLAVSTLAFGAGMGGNGEHAGVGAHPMPSLMRIVKKHADQLNLSEEQNLELAAWREKSHDAVHGKMDEIGAIAKDLQNAVIDGANRAQVNGYVARMDTLRDEIVTIKLKCRNNMREILDDKQWETLITLYREKFM